MKKCNICGKSISEFSSECPYCHNINTVVDSEIFQKKTQYNDSRAKINAVACLILSLLLVLVSAILSILYFKQGHRMSFINCEVIYNLLQIPSLAYIIFVLLRYKTILISQNKKHIIIAIAAGIIFLFLQIYKDYSCGLNIFDAVFEEYFIDKLIYIIRYLFRYLFRGFLITVIIFDINYLIRQKVIGKKSTENK